MNFHSSPSISDRVPKIFNYFFLLVFVAFLAAGFASAFAEKFDDFADKETKYKVYTSVINEKEEIKINVADIGRQLKSEMYSSEASWTDKVDYAVSNFTDRCQKVVAKLHHAISCFKNFLHGPAEIGNCVRSHSHHRYGEK